MRTQLFPFLVAILMAPVVASCDDVDALDPEELEALEALEEADAAPVREGATELEANPTIPAAPRPPTGGGSKETCLAKCSAGYQGCMIGAGAKCFLEKRGCLQHQWELCGAKKEGCDAGCRL